MLVCPKCRRESPGTARLCDQCGTFLSASNFAGGVNPRSPDSPAPSTPALTGAAQVQIPESAFQTLKLQGLATTAVLRQVREQARVRQAITRSNSPHSASRVAERLLADPAYRLREAAAWYFVFATHEEVRTSHPEDVGPHDRTRALWHEINRHADDGNFDKGGFEGACRATVELTNNPSAWFPLDTLILDIADARVGLASLPAIAEESTARWIVEGLLGLVSVGPDQCADAAHIVRDTDGLPERVVNIVAAEVLQKAADGLESAANAFESETTALFEQIGDDRSNGKALKSAAEKLAAGSRPWSGLVNALDDDPYSGSEGHALDRVAQLIRRAAVALYNHADDYAAAERLLLTANEIAQSESSKASHQRDARTVQHRRALREAIAALQSRSIGVAIDRAADVKRLAETDDEHVQANELLAVVERARVALESQKSFARQSQSAASSSGSGCGSLIGGLVVLGIIITIAGAIIGSSGDSSTSSSGGDPPAIDLSGVDLSGVDLSGTDQEGLAIDAERTRLEGVKSDLDSLARQIDGLARDIEQAEASYPSGMPSYIYDQYAADILQHNSLVRRYESLREDHNSDVGAFNRRVDAYNGR